MSGLDQFIRLIRYLRPYRLRLAAAFVCSALVAAFSGAYAWLVRPVLDEIFINKNETLLLALPLADSARARLLRADGSYQCGPDRGADKGRRSQFELIALAANGTHPHTARPRAAKRRYPEVLREPLDQREIGPLRNVGSPQDHA